VGGVFVSKDVQQLRASRAIVGAVHSINDGQATVGLREFERGIALAPDVTFYPVLLDKWLTGPRPETSPANERALLEIRYETLAKATQRNPYSFELRERLAAATGALFKDGDEERRDEVIERYVDLSQALPNYSEFQVLAAIELINAEAFDHALTTTDRWIALGNDDIALAQAWWARGIALVGLGDDVEAFNSFTRATVVRPEDQWTAAAHGALALILEDQGKIAEASAHRARQAELRDE
jgi:tetratricopeptide (TPR) repeat protein